jgi:putative transposase
MEQHQVSERRACRAIGQPRKTQRYKVIKLKDEEAIVHRIEELASKYGRYGTPRITAMLHREGYKVNHKRVERMWRQQGLKVPSKQMKRARLWSNDGSCIRLRAEHQDHVWSYDMVEDKTHDGRRFRILNIIDEYTRECLMVFTSRRIRSIEVKDCLIDLFIQRGMPEYLRSDNGSEFVAKKVQEFLMRFGTKPTFIEPGSPWENGFVESFNGKMRDELLNREIFYTIKEAKVIIEQWRQYYNTERPHSSLNYNVPVPQSYLLKAGLEAAIRY